MSPKFVNAFFSSQFENGQLVLSELNRIDQAQSVEDFYENLKFALHNQSRSNTLMVHSFADIRRAIRERNAILKWQKDQERMARRAARRTVTPDIPEEFDNVE